MLNTETLETEIRIGFTLENAIQLAEAAHEGQSDRGGQPYINHPRAVMERLKGDYSKMAGILHDVVEDTDITIEDLIKLGVPVEVIEAIKLLTHPKDFKNTKEEYFKNINNIASSGNQIAIDVKFSDLSENSNIKRIPNPKERDFDRVRKYKEAQDILRPKVSEYLK